MTAGLVDKDRIELAERRMTDEVRSRVEKELTSRYAWIALIVAALTGGTITLLVKSNVDGALIGTQKSLAAAEALQVRNAKVLDEYEKSLGRIVQLEKTLTNLAYQAEETGKKLADVQTRASAQRENQYASSKEVLEVSKELDSKITSLASILQSLDLNNESVQRLRTLVTNLPAISRAETRAEKRQYPVEVNEGPTAAKLIDALKALGYSASIYPLKPEEKDEKPEDAAAIWLGKRVPFDVAREVIKTARKYAPHLRYVSFYQDGAGLLNNIFLGGSTSTAVREGLKPIPSDFFLRLDNLSSTEELHKLIQSYGKGSE